MQINISFIIKINRCIINTNINRAIGVNILFNNTYKQQAFYFLNVLIVILSYHNYIWK